MRIFRLETEQHLAAPLADIFTFRGDTLRTLFGGEKMQLTLTPETPAIVREEDTGA